jgi:hypothetical protein
MKYLVKRSGVFGDELKRKSGEEKIKKKREKHES